MYMYMHLVRLLPSNTSVLEAPGALRKKMVARRFLPRGPLSPRGSTTHGPGGTPSASLAQGAPLQPGGLSTYLARGAPLQPGGSQHIWPRGLLQGRCGHGSAMHSFSPGGSIIWPRGLHPSAQWALPLWARRARRVCLLPGGLFQGAAGTAAPRTHLAQGALSLPGGLTKCLWPRGLHSSSQWALLLWARRARRICLLPGGLFQGAAGTAAPRTHLAQGAPIIHCPGGSPNVLARGAPFIRLGGSASLGPAGSLCLFLPRGHFKGAEESAAPWMSVARGAF